MDIWTCRLGELGFEPLTLRFVDALFPELKLLLWHAYRHLLFCCGIACHFQTVDMFLQQSSWRPLLVHAPSGVRGYTTLLSFPWHAAPSAGLFSPLTEALAAQCYSRLMQKCLRESVCLCIYVWLWTPCETSVSWQPLPLAGKLSCRTRRLHCCRPWVGFTRLWFRHILSWSEILVLFSKYCPVLVNPTRITLRD